MRIGYFEVQVTSPESIPFHEVQDPSNGEIYIVAEAGKRFEVRYRIDPHRISVLAPGHRFLVNTDIDGRNTGSSKIIGGGANEGKHIGFVRNGDAQGITYDLFQFASATAQDDVEAESLDFQEGKIDVVFKEAREMPGKKMPNVSQNPHTSHVPTLPEGKKFFLAPSLTTASSGLANTRGFDTRVYNYVTNVPEAEFYIRYETPTTLLLRNILNRDNPAHAAILNSFPETRIVPALPATQPAASYMGSSGPGPSRHPRVKRERDASTHNEVIDLVDPTRVSIRITENLAPNEELVCDLTAEDDAPPQWQKRQKPDTEVEEEEEIE